MRFATILAIALVTYAVSNVAHEAIGHGGACLLVGAAPVGLNAVYFDCKEDALTLGQRQVVAAGGTIVSALLALGAALFVSRLSGSARYAAWLLATVSGLQAAGYWLFSGLMNVGDWAVVANDSVPGRVALAVIGLGAYLLVIRSSLKALATMIGDDTQRIARARNLTLIPYLAGGVLYLSAGALNPISVELVLISAAASSLGGTSALAWMFNLLRSPKWPSQPVAVELGPSTPWLVAAAVSTVLFVAVLGRTVTF